MPTKTAAEGFRPHQRRVSDLTTGDIGNMIKMVGAEYTLPIGPETDKYGNLKRVYLDQSGVRVLFVVKDDVYGKGPHIRVNGHDLPDPAVEFIEATDTAPAIVRFSARREIKGRNGLPQYIEITTLTMHNGVIQEHISSSPPRI